MTAEATVVIKGRNELSLAVRQAEQSLKGLLRTGDMIGKLFRGGAIAGAFFAFERLAESAEKAAEQIGDKGTAKALRDLNREIDNLKSKGLNVIGQVLGSIYVNYRGSPLEKMRLDAQNLRGELERLKQSNGGREQGLGPGYEQRKQQLAALEESIRLYEKALPASERRRAPGSHGGGQAAILTNGPTAKAPKTAMEFSAESNAYVAQLERMGVAQRHLEETMQDADKAIRDDFAEGLKVAEDELQNLQSTSRLATTQMTIFAEEAGRRMQSAFADFLFDPFQDGLRGMLSGFVDTVRRMVAEAMSAQILNAFFSWAAGATTGGVSSFFSSMIQKRAGGGPVSGGAPYLVGERGPELFVPNSSGTIIPNGADGAAVVQNISIDARGADAERIQALMPAWGKAIQSQTIAAVRELNKRGRLV